METLFDPKRYIDGNRFPKFRAILLGDAKVGKTSLVMRYMNHHFRKEYFPTKDVVIYKNLINFNPASDDENEYVYLEILDTVGYDRAKSITDFVGFFNQISRNDIQVTSLNLKLGKMAETIKYEFFFKKKIKNNPDAKDGKKDEFRMELSKRRLFSYNNIMAYVFVFDYNDDKSLDSVHTLCRTIIENESTKNEKRTEYNTVKVFIGNKYSNVLDEEMDEKDEKTNKIIYPIFDRDPRAQEILKKLKIHYEKDESVARQNIFFVNAKTNIGVNNAVESVFQKVFQKEELWNVKDYDSDNGESEVVKEEKKKGFFSSLFCCGGRDKPAKNNANEEEEIIVEDKLDKAYYKAQNAQDDETELVNPFIMNDDDEEYDKNYVIKPKAPEDAAVNTEPKKEEGKCFIF